MTKDTIFIVVIVMASIVLAIIFRGIDVIITTVPSGQSGLLFQSVQLGLDFVFSIIGLISIMIWVVVCFFKKER